MNDNPFYDLRWWSDFLSADDMTQGELLIEALCSLQGLSYSEYTQLASLLTDCPRGCRSSGYNGAFDERYLYPLYINYEVTLTQTEGRLELYAVDRHRLFFDKTLLISNARHDVDWHKLHEAVKDEIRAMYPHINGWHANELIWNAYL
ncbi:MAG: hypothetical protein JXR25_14355 [Pontiellaceae bacterium]|nr:hypothetical protein [Pontiellaceae bacterium]MBN2786001.1 hypothetical protein [Pontiellaceae bacterium]